MPGRWVLLDMNQTLVVDVFPQLHWESRRCWILWPFKFCCVQPAGAKFVSEFLAAVNPKVSSPIFSLRWLPCTRLYQKNNFLVRLVHFNQVGLVVHIIHLIQVVNDKNPAVKCWLRIFFAVSLAHLVDSHSHILLQLLQDGDDVQGCEPDNWPSTFFTDGRLVLEI